MTVRCSGATALEPPVGPGCVDRPPIDRRLELVASLEDVAVEGVSYEDIDLVAQAVTSRAEEGEFLCATSLACLLDAVARHPRTPGLLLNAMLREHLVEPDVVRENPALAWLSLEPFDALLAFPCLVQLLPLPRRTMLRVETEELLREAWKPPYRKDGVRRWLEHLESRADGDDVLDILEYVVRRSPPGEAPVRVWLALASSAHSAPRTAFLEWALRSRPDATGDHDPFTPETTTIGMIVTAARTVLELLPDGTSIERFGDGLGAYVDRRCEAASPPLAGAHRREIIAYLVSAICSEGGLEKIGAEMMTVFVERLARMGADEA